MEELRCRGCGAALEHSFVDLGRSPLANSFLAAADLARTEPLYPLHARVCARCLLVQLPQVETPERIFGSYLYFSSYSESWLRHAETFARAALARYHLGPASLVLEVGSNDGYLLQYFAAAGVPALGVEPATNVAAAATAKGLRTVNRFFGLGAARELAGEWGRADLVVANNVLAHVPDLNDFVAGLAAALKPAGVLTAEFPHVLRLILENQFDTIYHEHFCYFSLHALEGVLGGHGLRVFSVDTLPTHGGSLRVHAASAGSHAEDGSVQAIRDLERAHGLDQLSTYLGFGEAARKVRERLAPMLGEARRQGRPVAAYGAAAKGNTLLNYCGIGSDLIDYVADRNPHKQGLFLPGSRIPVVPPEKLRETRPALVLVLPWNLLEEILEQLPFVRGWGGRFAVAIPEPRIVP
jgi:SAM-dependent methyltransferase